MVLAIFISPAYAQDSNEKVLYRFGGFNGSHPEGGVIQDSAGNLYGTCSQGGASGLGSVYRLSPNGFLGTLYSFSGGTDGLHPTGTLLRDGAGNLYGVTEDGGANHGVVYKLAPNRKLTVLHTFTGLDGSQPFAGLISDTEGNFYGTTSGGGAAGGGTVFKLTPGGDESVLHDFLGSAAGDGWSPIGGLTMDDEGNLYGTTEGGGSASCDCGVVFKISPNGIETILHEFSGPDGYLPSRETLTLDDSGNLYGTTYAGGTTGGWGVVFKIAPDGTETVLYSFTGNSDGGNPLGGVIRDLAGNLYGTTTCVNCLGGTSRGNGVVYRLAPDGTYTVRHSFTADDDAAVPFAGLLHGKRHSFYGTSYFGGGTAGLGTIFQVR